MTERPILFSAPMVRAIGAGTKTQTRRMVKSVELARGEARGVRVAPNSFCYLDFDGVPGLSWRPFGGSPTVPYPAEKVVAACPYGAPGDRLWVRETWGLSRDVGGDWLRFSAGGEPRRINCDGAPRFAFVDDGRRTWRPSIHMPRWASRITLEVTGVRVERLCDISEEDARAEGVTLTTMPEEWQAVRSMHGYNEAICFDREPSAAVVADLGLRDLRHVPGRAMMTARQQFERLWESINGAESWKANPWVWVVEFKREAA